MRLFYQNHSHSFEKLLFLQHVFHVIYVVQTGLIFTHLIAAE